MIKKQLLDGRTRTAITVMLSLALLGVVVGALLGLLRGPEWSSSTEIQVRVASAEALLLTGQAVPISTEDLTDVATLAVSENILTRAAQTLGDGEDWTELGKRVSAEPVAASHLVSITATGVRPMMPPAPPPQSQQR